MPIDVAVVGGGPIGLAVARAASESGARTVVFERNPEDFPPTCCTGIISPRTLAVLGVSDNSLLREIRSIRVHIPSGRQIDLRSNEVKAVVIDRRELERELARNAQQAGATVQFESKAIGAESANLQVQSGPKIESIPASVIVGADGPRSQVAKWFSLEQPSAFISAIQVELEAESSHSDRVDVYVGDEVAPGFFGWRVPAEEGIMRVGVGVLPPHAPSAFLERLLANRFPHLRVRSHSAGVIPLAAVPKPTAAGVILVGDAAGHVKPLSGGGLYTGGLCARIAGETAARIAESAARIVRSGARIAGSKGHVHDLLAAYTERCLEAIGKEQAFGSSIRHYLSQLRDEDVEAAVSALDDRQFLQFLADHADIDCFHQLPDRLASEPRLWTTILRIAPLLGSRIE
ncbi:geranylgeranyl reductase family protein [Candidatus Bipolaricaulota bacterium]